jgi:hypothetical protein
MQDCNFHTATGDKKKQNTTLSSGSLTVQCSEKKRRKKKKKKKKKKKIKPNSPIRDGKPSVTSHKTDPTHVYKPKQWYILIFRPQIAKNPLTYEVSDISRVLHNFSFFVFSPKPI